MADLPALFTESAAARVGAATRWAELQQGIPQDGYGSSPGNGLCLVRTRTTLPPGYTGSMAVLGDVVEKQPDGTINSLGGVWIKDINGGTLSANTIYQARVGGTYAQDLTTNGITASTTLGLYLVQTAGSGGSGIVTGSCVSGRIQVDTSYPNDGKQPVLMSAILPNGLSASFTLLNASGWDWRFGESTISVHGMAIVTDPVKRTAQLSTVFPFLVQGECEKDYYGNVIWRGAYRNPYPVFDPLKLTTKLGTYFYGIMLAPCSFTSPPFLWLYMATSYGWPTGQFSHPWASYLNTSGISTGIGPGISGV